MLPRTALRVEAWMPQVQPQCSDGSTPAWTQAHEQESEVTYAPPLHDLRSSHARRD
jgi:hypothetical protein